MFSRFDKPADTSGEGEICFWCFQKSVIPDKSNERTKCVQYIGIVSTWLY